MERVPGDDPRLDVYRDLPRRPERGAAAADGSHVAVAEGRIVVERVLSSRFAVKSVLCAPAQAEWLARLARDRTPVLVADPDVLAAIVGFDFHRGCLAAVEVGQNAAFDPDDPPAFADRDQLTIVVAERLADPVNVGALVRNCAAFRVDLVLLGGRGASPFSRRAIRASMGNVFRTPVQVVKDVCDAVTRIRQAAGVTAYAAALTPGATPLQEVQWADRRLILLGHEGDGLSPPLLDIADERVTIPIAPEADSLNVAAATAVLLYAGARSV